MAFSTLFTLSAFCIASIAVAYSAVDASVHAKKPVCGEMCRFRWCRTDENTTLAPVGRVLNLRGDMLVSNPYVCLPDNSMARVLKTGTAKFENADGTYTAINTVSSPRFSKKFFQTAPIPGLLVGGVRRSGLKTSSGTAAQFEALDEKCIILPISKFEKYDPVSETVTGSSKKLRASRDCVSFSTFAPKLHFYLFWESSDDMDLVVQEPDGNELSRRSPKSRTGRFTNDNGTGTCDVDRVHNEAAVYRRSEGPPQSGEYTITVKMGRKCVLKKRVRYALRVYQDGAIVYEKRAFTKAASRNTVFTTKFTYPSA